MIIIPLPMVSSTSSEVPLTTTEYTVLWLLLFIVIIGMFYLFFMLWEAVQ